MPNGWKKTLGSLRPLGALVWLLCGACGPMTQSQRLARYNSNIENATKAIDTARDGGERAPRHAERGRAYSEKARYSRTFKLIADDEYGRLFDLAIKDHHRAVALVPDNAHVYLSRGRT
jgi:hypothetical protein